MPISLDEAPNDWTAQFLGEHVEHRPVEIMPGRPLLGIEQRGAGSAIVLPEGGCAGRHNRGERADAAAARDISPAALEDQRQGAHPRRNSAR